MSQWVCLDQECLQRKQVLEQLDIKLSQLRDAIVGAGGKTLTDIYDIVSDIKAKTDKLSFDGSNNLLMALNTDNVGIAKEATLSNLSAKFPNATALSDSMGNPTTTVIGSALLGFDGEYFRRIRVDTSGRLKTAIDSIPSLPSGSNIIGGVFADYGTGVSIDQQVGTTEVTGNAVDVRRRGRRIVYIKNTQDVDVTITIEGSYDGSNWFVIRDDIVVPKNDYRIGELNGAFGYIRAKAVASATPTTGLVLVVVGSLT
mgnify:CR=1 FL=1